MIPCAYLRVFRPLDAFADDERSQWERYIVSGGPPAIPRRRIYREESYARDRRVGLLAADEGDHADVRLVDGRYYVCPWRTKLRVLASLLSLRETAPAEMADALVPEGQARRAARELARMKRREPSAVPSMLQSAWHVPPKWFVLVDDDERHLVEVGDRFRLYYWTPIGLARGRVSSAIRLLRRSDLGHLQPPANEMLEWLSAFGADAAVELDYASLSDLFTWDELDNDHSGRDMQETVRSLRDPAARSRSVELYQSMMARWSEARNRESLN